MAPFPEKFSAFFILVKAIFDIVVGLFFKVFFA
jgi:hypothetical protein